MLGSLIFALAGASAAHAATFNVTVGANGNLAYNPPFINGEPGDLINFIFNPKNHSVTQSSFDQPCTPLFGGSDSGFNPVAQGTTDLPTWQVEIPPATNATFFFHCKQPVGNHCGHGMVFAINPPDQATFDEFQARANATLNATVSSTTATAAQTFTTPPPQPWATATATVTNGTSVWTSTYTSYLGSVPPSPNPQPIDHRVTVGANGLLTFSPSNITAQMGETVTLEFHPKNHTVTQSSFSNPCVALEQTTGSPGFNSGFNPVSQDATQFPTFTFTVTDTAPIWAFCGQVGHCGAGMVFSVNAVESGPNNFENFRELAKRINGTSTTTSASGPTATSSSDNSSSALSSPHVSIVTLGFLLLGAALL